MFTSSSVCRYCANSLSSDIDSLENHVRSRTPTIRMEGFVTPRPTPERNIPDTRDPNLSQILDIEEKVVEKADQTNILATIEQATEHADDASVMNGSAY